jgi:pimeloyl-ACP methyl ester carboxylesterase
MMGMAPVRAHSTDSLPVPRHESYRRPGGDGLYRLHYCEWGRADNPRVVVCVHGYHRSARDFDALARDLSAHFRVICPDLAGRGEGDWLGTATEHSFPQLLADLDGLLSGLGVDEVDWIGTSLGAILGMHLAVQPGTPIRRLVMKNVGECLPVEALPPVDRPLSAPLAGVHSVDLWRRVRCPTVLLRGDAPSLSTGEVATVRRFLVQEGTASRREADARESA